MSERVAGISTLDELRKFVHETLCQRENLVRDQFRMLERELKKCGRRCGLQFSIHGPRQVRLSAVWASDRNHVFFYDASGARFMKIELADRIPTANDQAV